MDTAKFISQIDSEIEYSFQSLSRCDKINGIIDKYNLSDQFLTEHSLTPGTEGLLVYAGQIIKWILAQIKKIGKWLADIIPTLGIRILSVERGVTLLRDKVNASFKDMDKISGKNTSAYSPGQTIIIMSKISDCNPAKFLSLDPNPKPRSPRELKQMQEMNKNISNLYKSITGLKSNVPIDRIDPLDYLNTADSLRSLCEQCTSSLKTLKDSNAKNKCEVEAMADRPHSEQEREDIKQSVLHNDLLIQMFKTRSDVMLMVARDLLKSTDYVLINGWTRK